jgi:hypothetical protein
MTHQETNSPILPEIETLKAQARRLRQSLAADGTEIGHSKALELLAAQMGYRDWNTLHAAAGTPGNRPKAPVALGQRVRGHYLNQPFEGEVVALHRLGNGTFHRVTLHFDTPVDVVRFDSFSSMRHRVNATIDAKGVSPSHTSDGEPHLRLAL